MRPRRPRTACSTDNAPGEITFHQTSSTKQPVNQRPIYSVVFSQLHAVEQWNAFMATASSRPHICLLEAAAIGPIHDGIPVILVCPSRPQTEFVPHFVDNDFGVGAGRHHPEQNIPTSSSRAASLGTFVPRKSAETWKNWPAPSPPAAKIVWRVPLETGRPPRPSDERKCKKSVRLPYPSPKSDK